MNAFATDQARWEGLISRDPSADGAYVYGVVTTGIYCRPTCASRLPNRENVRFFGTCADAEQSGFRACKRCSPEEPEQGALHQEAIARACRLIEGAEKPASLSELAQKAGFSPSYFHRLFKKVVGVTPKQYASAVRAKRVREELQSEGTVTEAIYEAGYASGSRFYDQAQDTLGMQPTQYRAGASGLCVRFVLSRCYLGWVLVAATQKGGCNWREPLLDQRLEGVSIPIRPEGRMQHLIEPVRQVVVVVSIPIRPEGRMQQWQSRHRPPPLECFNPHPPRRADATVPICASRHTPPVVSIPIRPEGRMQLSLSRGCICRH